MTRLKDQRLRLLAVLGVEMEAWRERAACRHMDTNLWFPKQHQFNGTAKTELAKAICGLCPVRQECLDYALRASEQHGLWGGLNLDERRRYRRGRST